MSVLTPLRGGVLAVEWVLELYDMAVPFAQEILLFGVILHQLGQRCKFLAPIQVIVVARVLDLNVGHLIITPEREKPQKEFTQLVLIHVNRGGPTPKKHSAISCLYVSLVCLHPADI